MSYTFSITGKSTTLTQNYNPPIQLDQNASYEVALLNLETWNSLQNITEYNNSFIAVAVENNENVSKILKIPTGTYEIEDIEQAMLEEMSIQLNTVRLDNFSVKANPTTMKIEITSPISISFAVDNSLGTVLGFDPNEHVVLQTGSNQVNVSNTPPQIYAVNVIRVDCNLATQSFFNDQSGHIIHEFFPTVQPGFKLSVVPKNLIYLPLVNVTSISNITIKLLDQKNRLVDNNNEELSIRIHIKKQHNGA